MKAAIIVAIIIQVVTATQSDGLLRSLSELAAFALVIALVFMHKKPKKQRVTIESEDH
ncbi:hypothetical protein ACODM8_02835 [Vibrio ostreicida]|uniref:O-succinylbenzoic acid--CoA ligase n=1 Tax=Vibrio ostreicida TaxID=526588 RepID=A0ABT8BWJ9_9VIBR|nr:hypothetical protein [Vibrio ostreicida]MDN3610465.1 hypothetical protein [Vibrio ostreicida]NPD07532.1 hypothetical protein [Vibrio ostreicida]